MSKRKPEEADLPDVDDLELADAAELEALLAQAEEVPTLDAKEVKRLLIRLEKCISSNQEMRLKHAGNPHGFMESEMELDEHLKALHVLASSPTSYETLVALGCLDSLVSLLTHENADIACDVIALFSTLVDAEVATDDDELVYVDGLIVALMQRNIFPLLVQNLMRLNATSEDERRGMYDVLALLDHMIDVREDLVNPLLRTKNFATFVCGQIQSASFDEVKAYACELLVTCLQMSPNNIQLAAELELVSILMIALSKYKKRDPEDSAEEEHVENLFNAISACLFNETCERQFMSSEGIQLLCVLVKSKQYVRSGALRVLSLALQRIGRIASETIVESGHLGTIFGAFMGRKGLSSKRCKRYKWQEGELDAQEAHCVSCVHTMAQTLSPQSPTYARFEAKFVEKDLEKVERLVELHRKYFTRVQQVNVGIEEQRGVLQQQMQQGIVKFTQEEVSEMVSMWREKRVTAGLLTLQFVDFILTSLCAPTRSCSNVVSNRTRQLFGQFDAPLSQVTDTMLEYAADLADVDDEEEGEGGAEGDATGDGKGEATQSDQMDTNDDGGSASSSTTTASVKALSEWVSSLALVFDAK